MRYYHFLSLRWVIVMFIVVGFVGPVTQIQAQGKSRMLVNKVKKLSDQNDKASPKVKRFIKTVLVNQMSNSAWVKAVEAQNSRNLTLDMIKKTDKEWKAAEDYLEIHDQMMTGSCADEVRKVAAKYKAIGETFVMDNKGANVCQNELTGDYWQGDEAKWKNSFNGGVGGLDVGAEKLDRSTNTVLQQVSLPIVNRKGKVVGAVCFGLITNRL